MRIKNIALKTIISVIIIGLTISSAVFDTFYAEAASPSASPTSDANTCNQKGIELGNYVKIAQSDVVDIRNDYQSGTTGRKYWRDAVKVNMPDDWWDFFGSIWGENWDGSQPSVYEEYLTRDGITKMNEIKDNFIKAMNLSDEMEKLNCSDNTIVPTNTYGSPGVITDRNYKDIKENVIPKIKKIFGQIYQQQSESTLYQPEACQKKCEVNMKTSWLKIGYCSALCLVDEAFTTFITWTINVLISAAGVS